MLKSGTRLRYSVIGCLHRTGADIKGEFFPFNNLILYYNRKRWYFEFGTTIHISAITIYSQKLPNFTIITAR
jgi:hypothetical protein